MIDAKHMHDKAGASPERGRPRPQHHPHRLPRPDSPDAVVFPSIASPGDGCPRPALVDKGRVSSSSHLRGSHAHSARGFTLVEMIGALAVIAVLALLATPATLRHLDILAARQELARLKSFGDAFQAAILRAEYIPSHTDWATVIAQQTGLDITDVTTNPRRHARAFLIDQGGWLSTNVPYAQNHLGTPVLPSRARVMLVSTIGKDLPVSSGMTAPTDFDALWNAAPDTVPASWSAWGGRPDDVLIHRLNLSPLFIKLVLTTYISNTNGQFAIGSGPTNQVPVGSPFTSYFLKGTVLKLHTGPNVSALDSTQVLNEDRSFVYEAGMWRDSIVGRVVFGLGDVSGIVAAFLAATPNTNAINPIGNAQQVLVVSNMINYLSNYSRWAAGPSPAAPFSDDGLHDYLASDLQPDLMHAVRGLYSTASSYNNYPTNGGPCP